MHIYTWIFGSELLHLLYILIHRFYCSVNNNKTLSAQNINTPFFRPRLLPYIHISKTTKMTTGLVWYNFPDDDVESPILKQGVVESVTLDYG